MPRSARLDAPLVLHHVWDRGIERRSIFLPAHRGALCLRVHATTCCAPPSRARGRYANNDSRFYRKNRSVTSTNTGMSTAPEYAMSSGGASP